MKIRSGFVSNSSSSSFVAVGFGLAYGDDEYINELLEAFGAKRTEWGELEGLSDCGYGMYYSDEGIYFYCNEEGPKFVGLNAEEELKKDLRLSEMKKKFVDIMKGKGYDINEKKLRLEVDTCGW